MKESIFQLSQQKNLPPSLSERIKEHFGKAEATWTIEHARVLRSLVRAGLGETAADKLGLIMKKHAKFAGLTAAAGELLLAGSIAGLGLERLTRKEPLQVQLLGLFDFSDRATTTRIGIATEAVAFSSLYIGPVQHISRFGARIYGSAVESVVNSVDRAIDQMRSS